MSGERPKMRIIEACGMVVPADVGTSTSGPFFRVERGDGSRAVVATVSVSTRSARSRKRLAK